MKFSEIMEVAREQLSDAFEKVNGSSIEGITFTLTYKKSPSLETSTKLLFKKGSSIEE